MNAVQSFDFEADLIFEHFLKLFILNLSVSRVVDRTDELFDVYGKIKLFLDDLDQHLPIDMSWFVGWAAYRSVRIQSDRIIFPVDFSLSLLLIHLQDLFELDVSLVFGVKFWDEFAQFKLFKVHVQSLEDSFEVVDVDEPVPIII